ncbi:hypothetical protein [Streptomyces sp. AP-93]|uniref:hypothetical protein n=1 Tax=Streptomyces sp. AP-93 TaxID=2929048 RepID=UPI001FAEC3CD|nr:hypothetical protein [Streptomyces sp. AP-93]MCJ0873115.1 hypothetical protein [Streptomyces sp. AP-93]
MGLVRFWAEDNATAREFPGAEWTVDEEAQLYGVVAGEEDAQAWADYLGIDLARTRAGTLTGHQVYTPEGPFGPAVLVTLTSR